MKYFFNSIWHEYIRSRRLSPCRIGELNVGKSSFLKSKEVPEGNSEVFSGVKCVSL
jgi:hypothetical protein